MNIDCTACAGSGEDFNEGDTCHVCSGTGVVWVDLMTDTPDGIHLPLYNMWQQFIRTRAEIEGRE